MNPTDRLHELFSQFTILYAGTAGLDKTPAVHPVFSPVFLREAFSFPMAKCDRFYAELSLKPAFRLCAYNAAEDIELQVQCAAEFSEDASFVQELLPLYPGLTKRFGKDPGMYIACVLSAVRVTLRNRNTEETFLVPDSKGLIVKISLRKDNEIRDRILKLIERRAESRNEPDDDKQKLYDGALILFAEAAKELWPRMNILPLEQSLIYETYNEREEWVSRAKEKLGNLLITKPEDLTYSLSPEVLFQ